MYSSNRMYWRWKVIIQTTGHKPGGVSEYGSSKLMNNQLYLVNKHRFRNNNKKKGFDTNFIKTAEPTNRARFYLVYFCQGMFAAAAGGRTGGDRGRPTPIFSTIRHLRQGCVFQIASC